MIDRIECPICAQQGHSIFRWPYQSRELLRVAAHAPNVRAIAVTRDYEVLCCDECDISYQRWVPNDQEAAELYALHGNEDDILDEITQQKLHWYSHMTEEILVMRQIIDKGLPKVLDYGCNWGKWASMALAYGCDVYAVEVNSIAADFVSRRGVKMISDSQLAQHTFDFINADQVLEHLPDPKPLLARLASALTSTGMIKLSTPSAPRLSHNLTKAARAKDGSILSPSRIDALEPLIHLNLFSNRSLRVIGDKIGLVPVVLPFFKWLGAGQLWNIPRQFGRNLTTPGKRRFIKGTYMWFRACSPTR